MSGPPSDADQIPNPNSYPEVVFGAFPPVSVSSEPRRLAYSLSPFALTDANVTLVTGNAAGASPRYPSIYSGTLNALAFTTGRVLTFPTAAAVVASLPNPLVGTSLNLTVVCGSGGGATLTAGAGGSQVGNMVVNASASGQFRLTVTNNQSGFIHIFAYCVGRTFQVRSGSLIILFYLKQ